MSHAAFLPNFIILSQVVAEKSLTEDLHIHYIGLRQKFEKEVKINILNETDKQYVADYLLHRWV